MNEIDMILDKVKNIKVRYTLKKLVDKIFICALKDVPFAYDITLGAVLMAEAMNEIGEEESRVLIDYLKKFTINRIKHRI